MATGLFFLFPNGVAKKYVDAFQDQHTNALERAARRGSSLQRLLRRPVSPVPLSGQIGRRRQISDEAYER